MKPIFVFIIIMSMTFTSCDFRFRGLDENSHSVNIEVQRYDRLESRYLTTGDFSALQEMNTEYPIETRTLIEKVLRLGQVQDYEIHRTLLRYYQDTTLQMLIADVEAEYADMTDINMEFSKAFSKLNSWLNKLPRPRVYAQIGSLDQSIIVGDKSVGIALDKYMGKDYPLYHKYYTESQRESMTRIFIVPDALLFYLLSLYPMSNFDSRSQLERDLHVGKMMWIVNEAVGRQMFKTKFVDIVSKFMKSKSHSYILKLIESDNFL